jgi:branched-chain amino acid transport system substrate-binding protein
MVLLLFTLVGAGCSDPAADRPVFRIGLIAPISGQLAEVGKSSIEAAKLAVEEINASGGLSLGGAPVRLELLIEDGQDRAEASVSAALRLINRDRVSAIVGPQASRNAIPAARVAERAQVPLISPWSTHPETTQGKRWVFRVAFVDTFQGQVMARFARQSMGISKVGVLFDAASEYNRGLAEEFRDRFVALGGAVVAFESYTRDAVDVSAQLARIKDSAAEALFLPNYHNEVPSQVRQARALGIQARLIGSDTWAQIPAVHRRNLEGAFFVTHYATDTSDDRGQQFVRHYQATYGKPPDDVAALTYDAFGLLIQAAQQQQRVDARAIRDGLAAIGVYQGVTGRIAYGGTGDPVKSAVVMEVRDGRFRFHARVDP